MHANSIAMRAPRRITTTLPNTVFDDLVKRSLLEGRSLSNLAAYLLECALRQPPSSKPVGPEHAS